MFRIKLWLLILTAAALFQSPAVSQTINPESKIKSVKLYTNRAEITRTARIQLKKGLNHVLLDDLPDNLYDWSAKATLPSSFNGKIMSLEVSKKALLEKRRKKIFKIEGDLETLKDEDTRLADELENLRNQEHFLNSIGDFSKQTAAKELATKMPGVEVWSKTSGYLSTNRRTIQASKRKILKQRMELAKKIQKLEFELNQIAGRSYYDTYLQLNEEMEKNTKSVQVQQYGNVARQYERRNQYLTSDTSGLDTEKRIMLDIYSTKEGSVDFKFSYIIPGTYWNMMYDFRASKETSDIEVIIYSNIYQKTGEDWENIDLSLSTGTPLNNITVPELYPWYLSAYEPYKSKRSIMGAAGMSNFEAKKEYSTGKSIADEEVVPKTSVKKTGLNFEISFPISQSIESSEKYQKKYLRSYKITKGKNLRFFYKVVPSRSSRAFFMATAVNSTGLPWLNGEAQIFLENEFIGKTNIAETPQGKDREMVLGMDSSIISKKELVKKFEDKSGIFGGNRKIIYTYKITLENTSNEEKEVLLLDNFPVSRNSKIEIEIKNLTHKYMFDEKIEKTSEYLRGIRKFSLKLAPGKKTEISYDAEITFDKELNINGLR